MLQKNSWSLIDLVWLVKFQIRSLTGKPPLLKLFPYANQMISISLLLQESAARDSFVLTTRSYILILAIET